MLSGIYQTAMLTRHFGPDKSESCPAPSCPPTECESLEHLLVFSPHYKDTREKLTKIFAPKEGHGAIQSTHRDLSY